MANRHFRGRVKVIGVTLVVALMATMGAVLAVSAHVGGVSPGVIHSCVNKSSGEIKIVGATDTCKQGDKGDDKADKDGKGNKWNPLDWNAVGPIGPAGPTGPMGATGATGATGTNGTNGIDGLNGTNGTNGTNGIDGKDGLNGTNGIDGLNGTNGTNGIDGLNGTNGTNGIDGKDGLNGTNGTNGIDGKDSVVPGPAGPIGPAGPAGSTLVQGLPGNSAVAAVKGSTASSTATCPAGKVLLGGGGLVTTSPSGNLGNVQLVSSFPSSTTEWTVKATNNTNMPSGSTFSVTAYALCSL